MSLPQDPLMLLSVLNMKLRDGDYESLSDLCASLDLDEKELINRMHDAGFDYNQSVRQFR